MWRLRFSSVHSLCLSRRQSWRRLGRVHTPTRLFGHATAPGKTTAQVRADHARAKWTAAFADAKKSDDIFAVYDTYKDHMVLSDFVILLKKLTDLKMRYLSNLRISSDANDSNPARDERMRFLLAGIQTRALNRTQVLPTIGDYADLCRGMAHFRYDGDAFWLEMAETIPPLLLTQDATKQQLLDIVWSFGRMKVIDHQMMFAIEKIGDQIMKNVGDYKVDELAVYMWACQETQSVNSQVRRHYNAEIDKIEQAYIEEERSENASKSYSNIYDTMNDEQRNYSSEEEIGEQEAKEWSKHGLPSWAQHMRDAKAKRSKISVDDHPLKIDQVFREVLEREYVNPGERPDENFDPYEHAFTDSEKVYMAEFGLEAPPIAHHDITHGPNYFAPQDPQTKELLDTLKDASAKNQVASMQTQEDELIHKAESAGLYGKSGKPLDQYKLDEAGHIIEYPPADAKEERDRSAKDPVHCAYNGLDPKLAALWRSVDNAKTREDLEWHLDNIQEMYESGEEEAPVVSDAETSRLNDTIERQKKLSIAADHFNKQQDKFRANLPAHLVAMKQAQDTLDTLMSNKPTGEGLSKWNKDVGQAILTLNSLSNGEAAENCAEPVLEERVDADAAEPTHDELLDQYLESEADFATLAAADDNAPKETLRDLKNKIDSRQRQLDQHKQENPMPLAGRASQFQAEMERLRAATDFNPTFASVADNLDQYLTPEMLSMLDTEGAREKMQNQIRGLEDKLGPLMDFDDTQTMRQVLVKMGAEDIQAEKGVNTDFDAVLADIDANLANPPADFDAERATKIKTALTAAKFQGHPELDAPLASRFNPMSSTLANIAPHDSIHDVQKAMEQMSEDEKKKAREFFPQVAREEAMSESELEQAREQETQLQELQATVQANVAVAEAKFAAAKAKLSMDELQDPDEDEEVVRNYHRTAPKEEMDALLQKFFKAGPEDPNEELLHNPMYDPVKQGEEMGLILKELEGVSNRSYQDEQRAILERVQQIEREAEEEANVVPDLMKQVDPSFNLNTNAVSQEIRNELDAEGASEDVFQESKAMFEELAQKYDNLGDATKDLDISDKLTDAEHERLQAEFLASLSPEEMAELERKEAELMDRIEVLDRRRQKGDKDAEEELRQLVSQFDLDLDEELAEYGR